MNNEEQSTWDFLTWVHEVDQSSFTIENVSKKDYPDFCDAYISEGFLKDGTPLTDAQLERYIDDYFPDEMTDLIYELAHESLY